MLEVHKDSVSCLEFFLLVTVILVLDTVEFSFPLEIMWSELSKCLPTSTLEPRALFSLAPENCCPPLQSDANEIFNFIREAEPSVAGQWTACLQTAKP